MKKIVVFVSIALTLCYCSSNETNTTKANDAVLKGIDSSAMINDSTRLPMDSTTTVTH